jgi:hypothetical protein
VLFNEPKLLKSPKRQTAYLRSIGFSALQRAEIAEIAGLRTFRRDDADVSVLFNEPKLLKSGGNRRRSATAQVSVLFNEPKLLKSLGYARSGVMTQMFQCSSTSRIC